MVLFGLALVKAEGFVVGLLGAIGIALGCGAVIRLRKWQAGVPRDSSDY